jgi:hypothetical protein
MKMVSRNVGRCVTEYKREDFAQIVSTFKEGYVTVSQFTHPQPKELGQVKFGSYGTDRHKEPRCSIGEHLYGINDDGTLTELMSIIDSSD